MMDWSYHCSTWVLGLAYAVVFLGSSWAGIFLTRRTVHAWFHRSKRERENDMVGVALTNCFLVLGLLLGLVAVGTYQNYSTVADTVDKEASTLAVFAMDTAAYPPPYRSMLTDGIVNYIKTTVTRDWPEQREGKVPLAGTRALLGVGKVLLGFEPVTENQKILQARSFENLNHIIDTRRSRISMMHDGLPAVLWWVVGVGVFLNLCLIWLQDMEAHAHYVLGAVLSLSLGSVVFLTAVLENPFRGQTGVGPESIENVANMIEKLAVMM